MLAKLRRRFVLITMGLVGLILLAVLAASVISSYQTTAAGLMAALDQAVDFGSEGEQPQIGGQSEASPLDMLSDLWRPNQEAAPLQQGNRLIPVYVIVLDIASGAMIVDNSAFVAIDPAMANEAVTSVLKQMDGQKLAVGDSSTGVLPDLKLFYRVEVPSTNDMAIALADASELFNRTFMLSGVTALIWLIAMVVLFFVSLLLSRIVTRPAAQAWEQQRRFVADASHELKTPLAVILANNSLLTAHSDQTIAEQRQWVESTQAEAQRMDGIVRDLLLLAQTDGAAEGPITRRAPLATVDLSALVKRSLLQFEAVLFERNIALTADIAEGVTVAGNPEQLERLIQILLDNASKYAEPPIDASSEASSDTPSAPWRQSEMVARPAAVRVSLRPGTGGGAGAGHAILEVTNTGRPIAPAALAHLFERFYRADSAHSDSEGSGLGLALARSIVEAHHGSITVSSTTPQGTTFTTAL
jgi:signal transduction histidine kinase